MEQIKSNTTFWNEISEYTIQVPDYQRDYAQGRKDGGRIDNIRKVFVEELYQAIKKDDKICHLGLVFGSYDDDNKVFIAVDGQQRLTTVFLLHWYVALRENRLEEYKEFLRRFSWNTRSYASQFVDLLFKVTFQKDIITSIKTNPDYFSIWESDPTVQGMLTMLAEIESQYSENDSALCEKLFSLCCNIQYDILHMDKGTDGKTYLKMNSRGRSLTTFELFKSKFIDKYKPTFSAKFDNEWLNFMLERSKIGGEFGDPDVAFMNFINEYTYLQLKFRKEGEEKSDDFKDFVSKKKATNLVDIPFISFERYDEVFQNEGQRTDFEKSFDWIVANYDTIKKIDDEMRFSDSRFFLDEIIQSQNPHYSHRTKLFAALKYAKLAEYKDLDEKLYRRWTRVFRNLVANTPIDASNMGKICKSIDTIETRDLYHFLSNDGDLSGFNEAQFTEEVAKAQQILDEGANLRKYAGQCKPIQGGAFNTWEEIIIEAENYAFFKGTIRFLYQDEDGKVNWNEFHTKWENAKKYFDEKGVKDNNIDIVINFIKKIQSKKLHHYTYSFRGDIWKRMLLGRKDYELKTNHLFLMDNSSEDNENSSVLRRNLLNREWLNYRLNAGDWWFLNDWEGNKNVFTQYSVRRSNPQWLNQIWSINNNRNELLRLIGVGGDDNGLYKGLHIDFKHNNYSFRFYGDDYVYLRGVAPVSDGGYSIKDANATSEDAKYYCFSAKDIKDAETFKCKLNKLIEDKESAEQVS